MVEVVLSVVFAVVVVGWMVKTALGKKNPSNSSGGTFGGGTPIDDIGGGNPTDDIGGPVKGPVNPQ